MESELGTSATVKENTAQTFALAYRSQNRLTDYMVIRLSDFKIVIKEKIQGSVTWSGELQIKESRIPNMVKRNQKPEDNTRLIDLNNYIINKK